MCRKISLLIHPDRCKHPQAADAFEVLGAAQEELMNEETRAQLMRVLEYARDAVREERRKATKHDTAVRIAASLHAAGREGVEKEWEETDDFHEKWKTKSRDVLARSEFRRRKLNKRCASHHTTTLATFYTTLKAHWHPMACLGMPMAHTPFWFARAAQFIQQAVHLNSDIPKQACRMREEEERLEAQDKEKSKARKQANADRKEWLDKRSSRLASWKDFNKSVRHSDMASSG